RRVRGSSNRAVAADLKTLFGSGVRAPHVEADLFGGADRQGIKPVGDVQAAVIRDELELEQIAVSQPAVRKNEQVIIVAMRQLIFTSTGEHCRPDGRSTQRRT